MKKSIGFDAALRIWGGDVDRAIASLALAGFDGVDLGFCEQPMEAVGSPQWREDWIELIAKLRSAGLEPLQCHLHYQPSHEIWGDGSYGQFAAAYLPIWEQELALCGDVGCPLAAIHLFTCPDPEETFRANVALLEALLPHLERNRVVLAIENLYANGEAYGDCGTTTAAQLLAYLDRIPSPWLGACLDTGHAICTGQDPLDMARKLGSRLKATHINSSSGRDTHLLPGMLPGWIEPTDFAALTQILRENGFPGPFNLEVTPGTMPADPVIAQAWLNLAAALTNRYLDREGNETPIS